MGTHKPQLYCEIGSYTHLNDEGYSNLNLLITKTSQKNATPEHT